MVLFGPKVRLVVDDFVEMPSFFEGSNLAVGFSDQKAEIALLYSLMESMKSGANE